MRRAVLAVLAIVLVAGTPVALAAHAGAGARAHATPHKGAHHKRRHHKKHKRHKRKPAPASLPASGPALLHEPPAVAPQLTNAKPWTAKPILVSGASAYRKGEFLYQDYLYDDHGARETADPNDPRAAAEGDLFSKPNGTYTYPTNPQYASDAADLVEFRVKPLPKNTAFRVTLNTLENPSLVAFSIAIGGTPGQTFTFPDGANVVAPARMFLTVHPSNGKLVADLVHAGSNAPVKGPRPKVKLDLTRRQIQVEINHKAWNPRKATVRVAMGVGLWDATSNSYLLPQAIADATHPGGAGAAAHPAAFFNVAFRPHETVPSPTASTDTLLNAAWWRDQQQGNALASGDISSLFASVNFKKLASKKADNSQVPKTGPMDRILASHFEPAQGANFSKECGFGGASDPASCVPEYTGRLEPYAIYIPKAPRPAAGYGLTLLLHSLSANYNQYLGTRNQSEFGDRPIPSIVITPEARGPDLEYQGYGAADTFEVWSDVAHHYRLNPAYTDITGYSMGGIGTFTLGEQFPDLFARAQPTVGAEMDNNDLVASLRNVPVLMWNNVGDELVNVTDFEKTANALSNVGYRYELDAFAPCPTAPMAAKCSPLFPDHLELAVNDEYAPAAAFLGSATVDPNPAHVTYVVDTGRDRPSLGIVADHAYWVSGLKLRDASHTGQNGDPEGEIDAVSAGFGVGDPAASAQETGLGSLSGGNLGTLQYARTDRTWGPTPSAPSSDSLNITATNIASAAIDLGRAHLDCRATVHVTSDGPITVTLPGCGRTVTAG